MTVFQWQPRTPEIRVPFDPVQRAQYLAGDSAGPYHPVRWLLSAGRGRYGEFPLVVVREYFRAQGYTVWASEPELPDGNGYILLAYPGKRRSRHSAYQRMEAIFGPAALAELNREADLAKIQQTGSRGGGDPDLFVFREERLEERFFVEVKHRDQITRKQHVCFPLIERLCEVRVARLTPG